MYTALVSETEMSFSHYYLTFSTCVPMTQFHNDMTASSLLYLQFDFHIATWDLFLKCKLWITLLLKNPTQCLLFSLLQVCYDRASICPLISFSAIISSCFIHYTQIHAEHSFMFYAFVGAACCAFHIPSQLCILKHTPNHVFYDI